MNIICSIPGDSIFAQLDYIICIAYELQASDIHIDIKESHAQIILRVHGKLSFITNIPKSTSLNLVGRIKVLSGMRLDISDRSQDGAFVSKIALSQSQREKNISIRSATAPTVYGENVVCRLFAYDAQNSLTLTQLGLDEKQVLQLENSLNKESGLILVSGPTGSGKTTTLYSCLNFLQKHNNRIIVTLEDPVEIVIPHIRQIKVQQDNGYTFADALKGVLRQDPDIIMVGEIRDTDTAQLAVQAALTGHLVLATIHAPSAVEIIDRLHSLGVRSDMCASVIVLLMSQRGVSTIHGKKIVFELIEFSQKMKSTILGERSRNSLYEIIQKEGLLLLKDQVQNLYVNGLISKEEVSRYIK